MDFSMDYGEQEDGAPSSKAEALLLPLSTSARLRFHRLTAGSVLCADGGSR